MSAFLHVMVNYRNDSETKAFVLCCLKLKGAEQGQFIIANNSAQSQQDSAFQDILSDGKVSVFNCPDNPGYFGAAQRVLENFKSQKYQFVILSNTDLEIRSSDFYERLIKGTWAFNVGAIAPSIQSGLSQNESNPLYWERPSKKKIHFLKTVYSNFYFAWLYHVASAVKSRLARPHEISERLAIYAPHGCFLILTNHYFSRGGDFTHGVKLYGEEIVLAERLRQLDLKAVLWPDLKIFHREKGTEASWFHRVTLSQRTFHFKKEAAAFLDKIFN